MPLSGETESAARIPTGLGELDRVTGGGFVCGSAVLVGGDPGIGKSTLLLQAAAALAERGQSVVYVSGEEAVAQIRLRAQRLGLEPSGISCASVKRREFSPKDAAPRPIARSAIRLASQPLTQSK